MVSLLDVKDQGRLTCTKYNVDKRFNPEYYKCSN